MDPRSRIPGVDRLLETPEAGELSGHFGRDATAEALREALSRVRASLAGEPGDGPDPSRLDDPSLYLEEARRRLETLARPSLRPVINATGVILHTNLGRAPLADAARRAMEAVTAGYANLEYDLDAGSRGSRYDHCADLLARLTGAEAGLVVNNCAAGLALALSALVRGGDVAVSRGELVEIGGGFRIPEVLAQAGAGLREVGATNRCRAGDYEAALSAGGVSLLLKVHPSNFRISGFTEDASLEELARLARQWEVSLVHDLGSGLLLEPEGLGLPPEPTPGESVARGADLVIFSGDKLLGGPQAGLVVGRAGLVETLKAAPLCRALRVDKATLAGLEATLRLYLDPERARAEIPVLRMLAAPVEELRARAVGLRDAVAAALDEAGAGGHARTGLRVEVTELEGRVGGGTFPGVAVPSAGLAVDPAGDAGGGSMDVLARRLREQTPPVVGRVEGGRLLLDLRTVAPREESDLLEGLRSALAGGGTG